MAITIVKEYFLGHTDKIVEVKSDQSRGQQG